MGRLRSCSAAAALLTLCACVPGPNDAALCRAFAQHASGVEVTVGGTVTGLLGTRTGPSGPHEGFFLYVDGGCDANVRVETNVAFTGPIPLHAGERVVVKGEYEYDGLGGVVHFTHREREGHHPGGFVEVGGTYYW